MSAPTMSVRRDVHDRDEHRCVACGVERPLEFQHRRAEGMGGRLERPRVEDGLTACAADNAGFESHLQKLALRRGWKVRDWVLARGLATSVPVFYAWEGRWCRLTPDGRRVPVSARKAARMMRVVYGAEWDSWAVAS